MGDGERGREGSAVVFCQSVCLSKGTSRVALVGGSDWGWSIQGASKFGDRKVPD